ncbi:retron Ec78 anti-phage system effector HNH endonuclease PtuB [Providencia rettgeri]|uniref:retron Ec78 anti-phage system effector HNH endonuclease PtuB n=2 Tax=Providencia rettgeri TaxID=587 RepID=UPI00137403C9|nr:retron Ec78 anti-phage system effector HNH endonuclease PtuB [Providencia rettgeri]BBU96749.1 hypothetical protein BML2496_26320 [Providencia rettgeri]
MRGFRKKSNDNEVLLNYLLDHPEAKWKDDFRDNVAPSDLSTIYDEIYKDQKGICAYCEITLRWPTEEFTDDFRVEHFHPENCGDNNNHNYSLDWLNLLGCCHGGTSKTSKSYNTSYSGKKNHSCDVPKENKILDDIILNPLLDLPENITYFDFDEDGCIFVSRNCPDTMKEKAQATINELNLDCGRLRYFRFTVIETLREKIEDEQKDIQNEEALDEVIFQLREDLLNSEYKHEFYSTIDWYLP